MKAEKNALLSSQHISRLPDEGGTIYENQTLSVIASFLVK